MICKKCGATLNNDSMFCHICGTPVVQKQNKAKTAEVPKAVKKPGAAAVDNIPDTAQSAVKKPAPDPVLPSDKAIPRQTAPQEPKKPASAPPMKFEEDSMPEVGADTIQQYYNSIYGVQNSKRAALSPGIDDAIVTGRKQQSEPTLGNSDDLAMTTVKPIRVINFTPLKIVLRIIAALFGVAVAAGVVMYFTGALYEAGIIKKIHELTDVCIQHHYEPQTDGGQRCVICGTITESTSEDSQAA